MYVLLYYFCFILISNTFLFPGSSKKSILPVFTVTPTEITLRPRTATAFTFKGTSATPSLLKEIFVLESKVGMIRNVIFIYFKLFIHRFYFVLIMLIFFF